MNDKVSPKYLMNLINEVDKAIWKDYGTYKNVRFYIDKWHESDDYNWENFPIITKDNKEIDLLSTLHKIDGEILLKIAIDMGVETPNYIPCVPTFKNELKENYKTAFESFHEAYKQVEISPSLAIGLANSTLESIIKEILQDDRIETQLDKGNTLYKLTEDILKVFKMFPNNELPKEIRNIGSSLLKINQSIENLRSNNTNLHGKTSQDYIIDDSMYSYFIINSVSTIGLFLYSFYKEKYPKHKPETNNEVIEPDDMPF